MTRNQFVEMLIDTRVSLEDWGRDVDDKIDHLHRMHLSGQKRFIILRDSRLLMKEINVAVIVRHGDRQLVEARREYRDGSTRTNSSTWTLFSAVPENEAIENVAACMVYDALLSRITRCFSTGGFTPLEFIHRRPELHIEYPGLWASEVTHYYQWVIPEDFYRPLGYRALDGDCDIIYEWMKWPKGIMEHLQQELKDTRTL